MGNLYALTLHQPWACWISAGIKTLENRDWAPPPWMIGKPLAIHAGKTFDAEGEAWIRERFPHLVWPTSEYRRTSAIVAVVQVTAVIQPRHSQSLVVAPGVTPYDQLVRDGKANSADHQWWAGEHGWVLREAVRLPHPVPCGGKQKLWRVPEDVLPHVRTQFAEGRSLQRQKKEPAAHA
jgi:hypothetical protein